MGLRVGGQGLTNGKDHDDNDNYHPDYDFWDFLHPSYEPWDDHEDHIHLSLHPFMIQGKIMMTIRLGLSAQGVQFIYTV